MDEKTDNTNEKQYPELAKWWRMSRRYSIRPAFLENVCHQAFDENKKLNAKQLDAITDALERFQERQLIAFERDFPRLSKELDVLSQCSMGSYDKRIIDDMKGFFVEHRYLTDKQQLSIERLLKHYHRQVAEISGVPDTTAEPAMVTGNSK